MQAQYSDWRSVMLGSTKCKLKLLLNFVKFSVSLLGVVSFAVVGEASTNFGNQVLAQIIPDNTLGAESSTVTPLKPNSNVDKIQGGAVQGTNLFHSFREFNIGEGRGVYFTNPAGIQNIISRVTGSNLSKILGRLGVSGNANLFLINPNGIVFGSNASLDVGGSFIASTASGLQFADGTEFNAKSSQAEPLLTISTPVGLQIGNSAGSILVQGDGQATRSTTELIDTPFGLRVQPNQTLAFVGGDVSLEGGTLKTAGGRIELGSVTSPGLVKLNPIEKGFSLSYDNILSFGSIQLSRQATVDTSGAGGGDVQVKGRQVSLIDGSQIENSTLQNRPGGILSVNASDSVEVIGTSVDGELSSALATSVYPEATGTGGSLIIQTGRLTVQNGAQVFANTDGMGDAGSLTIKASDSVGLIGTNTDGLVPSALFTSVGSEATGTGGILTVETGRLTVRDGAQIFAGTRGIGKAGSLAVKASNSIELTGTSFAFSRFGSALATTVEPGATGEGSNLTIETEQLNIRDGALISSATFGRGVAGNITVTASNRVELTSTSNDGRFPSRITTRTTGSSNAGNLTIGTRQLSVQDGAEVNVSSTGAGKAGNLDITTNSIRLDNNGKLTAISASGEGGNIRLSNQNLLLLQDNSEISTDATAGSGNGGNININTNLLAAIDSSNITANAIEGRGGNILIDTQGVFLSPDSSITASSEKGINGVVEINRLDVEPSQGLINLPVDLFDVSNLIAQSCPVDVGPSGSRFVITGRGGLPEDPAKPLNKNTTWIDLSLISPSENRENQTSEPVTIPLTNSTADPLAEATGWVIDNDGQVVLTAAVPDTTIEIPWMTKTTCHVS